MPVDWKALSRQSGFKVAGEGLHVVFDDERRQQVFVEPAEDGESLRLWSPVAKPSVVANVQEQAGLDSPHLVAWSRNRTSDLVGFKLDGRGRLIGEAWVPVAGLDADEWSVWVRALAAGCDRLEYLLSGRDEH